MSETGETAGSGPTRAARGAAVNRPPTQFATAPIKPLSSVELGQAPTPQYHEAESNDSTQAHEEPSPENHSQGPSRAARSGNMQRPGTAFIGGPLNPSPNPSLDRHVIDRKIPDKAPGSPYPYIPNPAAEREAELIEQEKKAASQYEKLSVSPNELLSLASTEEIWERSEFVRTFRTKMNNLHVLQQLYVALANPTQSKLFGPISSGLGEDRLVSLHNKMLCAAAQLVTMNSTKETMEMVFRHNILDLFFTKFLSAPAPINELNAHYLREVINTFLKNSQERPLLRFLAGTIPGKSEPRASLLWDHFYCENIAYLVDELITAEEKLAQQAAKSAPPAGGPRGGPRGGPGGVPRGGPAFPGGVPNRGGGPGGPGGGPNRGRGGPGGPGGPGRGRGAPGGPGGPRKPGVDNSYKWTKRMDLFEELLKQYSGGNESGNDPMISVRSQYRAINSAHVIQGLLFRGWDFPVISKFVSSVDLIVDKLVDSPWQGMDVYESKLKVLTGILRYINKELFPNTPKTKLLEDAAESIVNQVISGKLYQALVKPPANTKVPKLKSFKNLRPPDSVGAVRIKTLQFFSFVLMVKFVDKYEQKFIQSGIFPLILDLFFDHQHNFFLHEVIVRSVLLGILKGKSDALFLHIFLDCKLLERIIDNWQAPDKSRSGDPSSYVSYNGHLLFLANTLQDSNYFSRAQLNQKLTCLDRWNQFYEQSVKRLNIIHNS